YNTISFFIILRPLPTRTTLFPYTTLFRSVKINIENGKATLQGTVKSQDEKLKIETAVQKVTGITSLDDQLRIGSARGASNRAPRSEEHTSELQSPYDLVCRLLLEKKNKQK